MRSVVECRPNFFAAFVDPKTRQTFGSGFGISANPLKGSRRGDASEIESAVSGLLARMEEPPR
ncbi:MAG: hypothetical protein V3T05_14570 [Myxococcota bacterium]